MNVYALFCSFYVCFAKFMQVSYRNLLNSYCFRTFYAVFSALLLVFAHFLQEIVKNLLNFRNYCNIIPIGAPEFYIYKGSIVMKITLDLDTNEIIVPKNFFTKIDKENEVIEKHGGKAVKPVERIKVAFNTAIADTDKYLHVKK